MSQAEVAGQPRAGSAGWWLRRREASIERRPRRDGLTLESIVATALDIVQAEGADALTMRRVADALDTGPASLYRHVAGRDELVALVVDHVLGAMGSLEATTETWRGAVESGARHFRAHLRRHLPIVPLIRSAQMLGPNSMAARETALAALLEVGLTPGDAVAAYLTIVHFTVGNVQLHVRDPGDASDEQAGLRSLFAAQDQAQFPTVVAHAAVLAQHHADDEFEFGLAAILDRIEGQVAAGSAPND